MKNIIRLAILIILLGSLFLYVKKDVKLLYNRLLTAQSIDTQSGYGYTTPTSCKCPYRYIMVAGQGSTAEHPMFGALDTVVPGAKQFFLSDGKKDDPKGVIEQIKKEVEQNKKDGFKTLIIAHSMGSVISINEFSGQPCVDIYAIDPPVNMAWYMCNRLYASGPWGSARCKALIKAKQCLQNGLPINRGPRQNCQVSWCTDGKCFPKAQHDPFSYPDEPGNKEKVDQIKKEIGDKIKQCKN